MALHVMTRTFSTMVNSYLRPVSHVIFDMDGLLLDTVPIYNKLMRSIVMQQGFVFTDELKMQLHGRNRRDCAELIVNHCENSLTIDDCMKSLRVNHANALSNCQFMPGAERLVRHFHRNGIPMAVGTSSSVESVKIKTKNHKELFKLMSHTVCGLDDPKVRRGKPAPDIFLAAAEMFPESVKPEDCLVFEDALNGVDAAFAAGMQVVLVSEREDSPRATMAINSLLDFQPEMFGLPPMLR